MATSWNSAIQCLRFTEPLPTPSLLSDPFPGFPSARAVIGKELIKGQRVLRRRPLLAPAGLRGPVPLQLGTLLFDYLRTATEAIARLYRAIVLREDRIIIGMV